MAAKYYVLAGNYRCAFLSHHFAHLALLESIEASHFTHRKFELQPLLEGAILHWLLRPGAVKVGIGDVIKRLL